MKVQKGCLILALFLAFLLPVRGETSEKTFDLEPAGADSGGPDGFGYRWISSRDPGGPAYSWIDITSVGVPTNAPDEWNSGLLPILPGPFWFYGNTFTNLAICANGWVSFTEGDSAGWPASLPDPAGRFNLIAPLGMDLDPFTGGDIYYWVDSPNSRTVVEWFATPHYGYPETLYTFELIINCSDSTIVLQYDNASNWIAFPAVVGIQNSDGTIALTVPQDSLADSLALKFYWVPPDSNVGVLSIGYPNDAVLLEPLAPCTVQATVENCGASTVSFDVRCDVDSSGLVVYTNTQLVSSLAADSTAPVRFPDWVPAEFIDYTVQVTTLLSGDKFPFNDRKSRRAKAPGPYYRELRWDDGIMTKRHYYPQYDSVMATEFFPPLYPALLKYVSIYCLSEGDLYWPYPDATHDPIGVGIWFDSDGDTMPDTLVYADTILGDSIPP